MDRRIPLAQPIPRILASLGTSKCLIINFLKNEARKPSKEWSKCWAILS